MTHHEIRRSGDLGPRPSSSGVLPRYYCRHHLLCLLGLSVFLASCGIQQSFRLKVPVPLHYGDGPPSLVTSKGRQEAPDAIQRAVFYNIFVPGDNQKYALSIVQEQLKEKQSSVARSTPIYYTLIGANVTDDVQRICNSLQHDCRLLRYANDGDEGLTLQSLHEYCQDINHPHQEEALVTYIHNKGSFHQSLENDNFRRLLTRAVFSDECQQQQVHYSTPTKCNSCSARFSPIPHFHHTGNMWTASCSYIQELMPPRRFRIRMDSLIAHLIVQSETNPSIPRPTRQDIRLQHEIGTRRFAFEHWIGSHPTIQPCDVYANEQYFYGLENLPISDSDQEQWLPQLKNAPRPFFQRDFLAKNRTGWQCGPAKLLEFQFLYHLRPPPESFVWSYYSQATSGCPTPIKLSGDSIPMQSVYHNPQKEDSSFVLPSNKNRPQSNTQQQAQPYDAFNKRVVFYNIFVPEDDKQTALSIVQEQLAEKKHSIIHSTPIYYTVIGGNATDDIQRICIDLQQRCHLLRYAREGDESLTLESLYDYCRDHSEALVTYIHDKGSFHNHTNNAKLRRLGTKAVFSNECQNVHNNVTDEETACTSCSARFAPFPYAQHTGNMWTASCSYIQKLLPPRRFRIRMDSLVAHLIVKSETNPSIPRPTKQDIRLQYDIGTRRFAFEHWVASHPSIQPCDVYPNARYLYGYDNLPDQDSSWAEQLQTAPRPFLHDNFKAKNRTGWQCGQAKLLEFQFLYNNKIPPPESYVWSFYGQATSGCPTPINQSDYATVSA